MTNKEQNIPTFIFHSVRPDAHQDLFTVDPTRFSDMMAFISDSFGTVDMRTLDSTEYADHKALITFDDGYMDNYEFVLPILDRYGLKGIFFILPKYIGKDNLWNTRSEVLLPHMGKKEIADVIASGHTIGSHGMTHHRLTKFEDIDCVRMELVESRQMLEDMFSVDVSCFAYPYGSSNEQLGKIASQVYRYSFSDDKAPIGWQTSEFSQIRREYIWPHSTNRDIQELTIHFGTYDNNPYKEKRKVK